VTAPARILAVAPGPPRDRGTWSGISYHLVEALERQGALAAAIDGRADVLEAVEKATTVSLDGARWRQRYQANQSPLNPLLRRAATALAARRARAAAPDADAIVQLGVWSDLGGVRGLRPRVRTSYQDGNLPIFLRQPDLAIPGDTARIRRTIAWERRVQDRMDLIFTFSEWVRRSMIEDLGQDPAKVHAVYAGANLTRIPGDPPDRSQAPPRLLFVGKNFERKGGADLLAAFREVHARRPDAELWIVGPTELPETGPGVRHFGRISRSAPGGDQQIDRIYREATAFVMPSRFEPFGIAFVEAMSWGLPCVGTTSCAMPEIITDERTGYVVPPGDRDRLAERTLDLVEQPAAAAAMGRAGRARFLADFTWDRVAERMVAAIGAAASRPSVAAA